MRRCRIDQRAPVAMVALTGSLRFCDQDLCVGTAKTLSYSARQREVSRELPLRPLTRCQPAPPRPIAFPTGQIPCCGASHVGTLDPADIAPAPERHFALEGSSIRSPLGRHAEAFGAPSSSIGAGAGSYLWPGCHQAPFGEEYLCDKSLNASRSIAHVGAHKAVKRERDHKRSRL